jgi:selenophosphate synthase
MMILADPQTAGGLLVAVDRTAAEDIGRLFSISNVIFSTIGRIIEVDQKTPTIVME